MSELAEGARLEIVCAVKSGTEGSNPSLSAIVMSVFGLLQDVFEPDPKQQMTCEPRQVRKEATVSRYSWVPQGCLAGAG